MALTKITSSLVAINAIQGTLIADNAITAVHIAQNAVTALQILNTTAPTFANTTITGTLGVTGVISPTTHIDMPDNAKIKIGTGDD